MMKRPWQVWSVFVVCAIAAAAAMIWLTQQALHADRLRRIAEAEAELEQRVSLALWRMDTELAPIIAEEVIRPPSAYRATFLTTNDLQRQQQQSQQEASQLAVQQPAQVSAAEIPTTVAATPPPYVLLQCEARPNGTWHSPQVPELERRELAANLGLTTDVVQKRTVQLAELAAEVKLPDLLAELPNTPLPTVDAAGSSFLAQSSARSAEERDRLQNELTFYEGNRPSSPKIK
jgi:hypothetical protein